jgi:hypothetical protein
MILRLLSATFCNPSRRLHAGAVEGFRMELWWGTLGTSLRVFYGIALGASVLLALQLLALLFGLDHDGDIGDHDSGLGILSVRSLTAFFTGFGWGGVVAIKEGFGLTAAIVVALATGGALMAAVVAMMRGFASLRHSGTLDYANAIGNVGSVYVAVPGAMAGPGQIEVLVQGRTAFVQAFTRSPERLPPRARVRVTETLDQQTVIVEPLVAATAPSTSPSSTSASSTSASSTSPSSTSAPSPPPAGGSSQEA